MKIVHVMPHMGGGVGKALSTLVEVFEVNNYSHSFIVLENLEKKQFFNKCWRVGFFPC